MSMDTKTNQADWNLENTYAELPDPFYSQIDVNPVSSPRLVKLNERLAKDLGLNIEGLKSEEGTSELAGNKVAEGGIALAQAYAGHQFGNFTMLGDGRALLHGEQVTPTGEKYDIQLKGSGRTPYSRGGDGRASLGPMLREYIISEAMHGLGIPTTRSLSVVTTGESVYRETEQQGAIMTRVASSHIRVGTFQYAAGIEEGKHLKSLADYTIARHFTSAENEENRYLYLLREVIRRQAQLIAKWQLTGFIHGVMNTDNMALSGETIDYGPCAFMNEYDPKTVFSSIDREGRYAYGNQPNIAAWNLVRFAETLLPLLDEDLDRAVELAEGEISAFADVFNKEWLNGMRAKLGIFNEKDEDKDLFEELLTLMKEQNADYTNAFRALTLSRPDELQAFQNADFSKWHDKWQERLSQQEETLEESRELMQRTNPAVIARNHRVEEALAAAVEDNDYSVMNELLEVLEDPYAYSKEQEKYSSAPVSSKFPYQTYCGT